MVDTSNWNDRRLMKRKIHINFACYLMKIG